MVIPQALAAALWWQGCKQFLNELLQWINFKFWMDCYNEWIAKMNELLQWINLHVGWIATMNEFKVMMNCYNEWIAKMNELLQWINLHVEWRRRNSLKVKCFHFVELQPVRRVYLEKKHFLSFKIFRYCLILF